MANGNEDLRMNITITEIGASLSEFSANTSGLGNHDSRILEPYLFT